jgi:hypothetical protein
LIDQHPGGEDQLAKTPRTVDVPGQLLATIPLQPAVHRPEVFDVGYLVRSKGMLKRGTR